MPGQLLYGGEDMKMHTKNFLSIICICLIIIFIGSSGSAAEDFTDASGRWLYTAENGFATIMDYIDQSADNMMVTYSHMQIPEELDAIPVTGIGDGAFQGRGHLNTVVLPEGVTFIGSHAFALCTRLTSVMIPETVKHIGDHAFAGCSSLAAVTIPEGAEQIEDYLFSHCGALTAIALPRSITDIGTWAFAHCGSLAEVILPDGLVSIGAWAFYGCSGLMSVTIPETVIDISDYAFFGCDKIQFNVRAGSYAEHFLTEKGYSCNNIQ
jgi:hypothetical protein